MKCIIIWLTILTLLVLPMAFYFFYFLGKLLRLGG